MIVYVIYIGNITQLFNSNSEIFYNFLKILYNLYAGIKPMPFLWFLHPHHTVISKQVLHTFNLFHQFINRVGGKCYLVIGLFDIFSFCPALLKFLLTFFFLRLFLQLFLPPAALVPFSAAP